MSDYCRTKAVMYPLGSRADLDNYCKALGVEDRWELEEQYPEFFSPTTTEPYFDIEVMEYKGHANYYLAYILYYNYGEDAGEFGRNRFLTPAGQEKYKPIFKQVIIGVDTTKLKYVDYCYYNCCESSDYYLSEDEFNNEI